MIRYALIALLLAGSAQAAEPLSPADREAIVAIAAQGDAAWNARDAAALSSLYTADARNTILGTPVDLSGREAIRAHFTQSLAKVDPALRHRTAVDELTRVADDIVVAATQVWVERLNADGTTTPLRRFTGTSVVVREGNAWRIRVNRVHLEEKV